VDSVVVGGSERQDSVYNAIQEINRKRPGVAYVMIHDAARPFVSEEVITGVIKAMIAKDAAVACVAMKDSIRRADDDGSQSVDRKDYFAVQTPQGFKKSVLIEAYDKALREGYYGTDDASLVERAGYKIELVEGDYQNIKITTKEDLPMENRVGTGFDVHRFDPERDLILGGVKIPHDKGLAGHSDADVLVHALMDALLGAAALGDIGRHFPDTDDTYKGISSMLLLKRVGELLNENFYNIGNVDVTVIAQKPKIAPYIEEMRDNISEVLGLEKTRINIKGTTTEKLGFTGREEGIAAEAVCSIYR
jgi:2-C-methyl-D-erythritol 4-phosphate cytidylyltransferase/2-C-methyl-D-erythritol 2,4-cyclodiphosphate synthase